MKIYQLLPTLAFGDAVSNDALALEKVIREMGYKTEIFAESIDARLPKGSAKFVEKLPRLTAVINISSFLLSTGLPPPVHQGISICNITIITGRFSFSSAGSVSYTHLTLPTT
mgnify:CR=1 FL=1